LITQSSPSRTARVLIEATSEPPSGSVTAIAETVSPLIAGTRKRRFRSSEPKLWSDGVAISVWTVMPHRDARVVAAPDLVEHDGGVAPVEPGAAPLRIVLEPEHPERAHLLVERLVEVPISSNSRARGTSSSCTNLRTVRRKSWCSGLPYRSSAIGAGA
jgi:hypothetical protein